MYKVIQLQGEDGEMLDVPFLANAATPFRFKSLFGQDLIVLFQMCDKNGVYDIDFVSQLAFIMAMQAEAKAGRVDLSTINKESLLSWLEKLDGFSIYSKAAEILDVYLGNTGVTSTEKKKARKPSAK